MNYSAAKNFEIRFNLNFKYMFVIKLVSDYPDNYLKPVMMTPTIPACPS